VVLPLRKGSSAGLEDASGDASGSPLDSLALASSLSRGLYHGSSNGSIRGLSAAVSRIEAPAFMSPSPAGAMLRCQRTHGSLPVDGTCAGA